MTPETTDLEIRIGSEIHASAEELLSGVYASHLRQLLEQRGVLVFRNLFFTKEQQIAFAHSLGRVQPQGEDGVFKITIDPAVSAGAEYLKGSFFWHIDGASDDMPNLAAILNAQVLSTEGGSTYFANTYAAYDDLPEDDKRWYDTLKVIHSFEVSQRYVNPEPTYDEAKIWQNRRSERVHPLVWKHQSGRKSLVLGSTTSHVEGLGYAEGRLLLTKLRDWATQSRFVYRHTWALGDLLLWDNTGTMHRVDPYPLESGRLLLRTTIEGEEVLVGA